MDYIKVINQPIDINLGTPFVVSIDMLPEVVVNEFDLTFEIMGQGLLFEHPNPLEETPYKITKTFKHDPNYFIQSCKITLNILGKAAHFPVRTVLRVTSQNSPTPVNCIINIYNANV